MTDKTFEEDFPNLSVHYAEVIEGEDEGICSGFCYMTDVQEHCIDKQRVKEVLTDAKKNYIAGDGFSEGEMSMIREIKDRLGL